MPNIFQEADALIYGQRQVDYGPPEQSFANIAEFWMTWFKVRHNITISLLPDDVAVMMSLMKHARLATSIDHRDTQMDIIGYIGNLERIQPTQQAENKS